MAADDEGFEARLAAARLRQERGSSAPRTRPVAGGLGPALRVGVELVSALAVGLGIGWALDRWLHTSPLFLIVFVLLGAVAGVVNVWRIVGAKPPRAG